MVRCLYVIILFLMNHAAAHAQSNPIVVSGQVRCGTEAVEGGIVSLLSPSDSSIVAYAMTDEGGHYTIRTSTRLTEMLVRVTGFNVKRRVQRIKAQPQTLNFNMERESMMLREAVVKAQKLWGSRDTLNYLVSAYTRDHDRSIGDVLRQLPGITVEDNGEIKYLGTPINHFYIENMDMLQGRYSLATQGIKAKDVATVQVLENHEHVLALQDQKQSERAAINLKLKSKAKGIWTTNADAGLGGYADGPLWEATLQTLYFGKSGQHMVRYSGDDMGHGYDAATAHYGYSRETNPCLVGMVKHGTAPVGNSLFGYRHGLNFNNLAKLSDSVTVNYNFNYSYNLSRGQSFSRTTYLLPDDTRLLLTEDVSDRTHIHSADLRLTYEKNTTRRFINNALSVFGQWNEGRGTVFSGFSDGVSALAADAQGGTVAQALHYRSLGLSNRTHGVRRTQNGGGLEWTSANSFASSPQALSVGEGMTARQNVHVTSVSTANELEWLRNVKAHRWTFSATTHLNATYTALTSGLTHPDKPMATQGDLKHWTTRVGLGPVAKYVNGTLQCSFRLPVGMAYTFLDNAPIANEKTDAHRIRLNIQPSFTLSWTVSDRLTVDADAGYAAEETSWTRLLTASMMQNYRSLSRYRATLDDSYRAGARAKLSYKDLFNSIFAYLEGGWRRTWSDVAYGTTFDEQAHTIVEAARMPNHANRYTLTAYGSKDIDWHTLQMEVMATGLRGKSEMLRQSVLTTYSSWGCILRGTLGFDILSGYRVDYSATWQRNRSVSTGCQALVYSELNQRVRMNFRLVQSRLFFNFKVNHTHNRNLQSAKKDYVFIGSGLQFKMSKKVELELNGDNLTGIRSYTTRSLGDMEEYYTEYHLRPLSLTLMAHISF